jgi:hypothetical protein
MGRRNGALSPSNFASQNSPTGYLEHYRQLRGVQPSCSRSAEPVHEFSKLCHKGGLSGEVSQFQSGTLVSGHGYSRLIPPIPGSSQFSNRNTALPCRVMQLPVTSITCAIPKHANHAPECSIFAPQSTEPTIKNDPHVCSALKFMLTAICVHRYIYVHRYRSS